MILLILTALLLGITYDAIYMVYALKKGDGGDARYAALLALTLLPLLAALPLTRGI